MLILECVETKKKGGVEWQDGQNGLLPIFWSLSQQGFLSLVSRQAIPCRDRARRLGTRPGRCARGRPAWVVGTRTRDRAAHARQSNARTTETRDPMSRQRFPYRDIVPFGPVSRLWNMSRQRWLGSFLCRDRVCVFGVAA